MNKLEKLNIMLIKEADRILKDYGLKILSKYGKPVVTGSYALKLMAWRDLDIHVEVKEFDERKFFELGKEIMSKIRPDRMHYRNELIMKDIELPMGLYWGVYTKILSQDTWKIDIWAMDSRQTKKHAKQFKELKSKINAGNRNIILTIKNKYCKHPEHRKKFTSMDIYNAVIEDNIKSVKEFSDWLWKKRGIK